MVIEIKKRTLAIASGILALFVIIGIGMLSEPAQAVTLPQPNITVLSAVTLPPVIVTRFITIRPDPVTVPGPRLPAVRTTVRLPGRIVTRNIAQPAKTIIVTVNGNGQTVRSTVPPPRQTAPRRDTLRPTPVTSTVTETRTVTLPPKDAVVLTKIKAAGISLLLVLIGVLLAIGLVWAAFTYGWVSGDSGNREFIKETIDDLRYDK